MKLLWGAAPHKAPCAPELLITTDYLSNMITDIDRVLTLKGMSGKDYLFDLYAFDDFHTLDNAFNAIPALYLFTRRFWDGEVFRNELIYLGETSDLSKRFVFHHKEECIMLHGANCIGIFASVTNDQLRKMAEADVLNSYEFSCNDINNWNINTIWRMW